MGFAYRITDPNGCYFITFATVGWIDVFVRPVYAQILLDSIGYCQTEKGLRLHGWCLMPSHLHLVASARDGNHLSEILRDLKKFTSSKILQAMAASETRESRDWIRPLFHQAGQLNPNNARYQFWQQDNHPAHLVPGKFFGQKMDYLHLNPVTAGFVEEPWHWRWSSAVDYWTNRKGLLDIEFA